LEITKKELRKSRKSSRNQKRLSRMLLLQETKPRSRKNTMLLMQITEMQRNWLTG
jgi:hypothetical protein